jgi:uncharacterized protein (TIGR03435 family)
LTCIPRAAAICSLLSAVCAFPQARFDVASIKPSKVTGASRYRESTSANPGSLAMYNVSLKSALQWAYRLKEHQVSGPQWIGDERYDIAAKASDPVGEPQLRAMLQNLLAERFKIVLHREKKILPFYALLVAKNGPKLAAGKADGKSVLQPQGTSLTAHDTSLGEVADLVTMVASRMNLPYVVDMTGLKGRYNFTVDGSELLRSITDGKVEPDSAAIMVAVSEILQEQLGLKAELRKAPADVLFVDRAEKIPTPN